MACGGRSALISIKYLPCLVPRDPGDGGEHGERELPGASALKRKIAATAGT